MKILVINAGSSSIKYQMLDMTDESVMASGLVERIGEPSGAVSYKAFPDTDNECKTTLEQPIPEHETGMKLVIDLLIHPEKGVIKDLKEIGAVGHRIVHGGDKFHAPTVVTDEVEQAIEDTILMAPLHNPAHLAGIRTAKRFFPDVPQVVVFDTAFHQTMPPEAYMYAMPYEMYEELRLRRYGAHGTSHKYVAGEAARLLGKQPEECNLITLHLGNGCSMSAVKGGECVDTSMGLTPLAGLIMGTRCGDIDPAVYAFLERAKGLKLSEIDMIMNKKSGLLGLCGMNDMRDIHAAVEKGDEKAELALNMVAYRTRKYIGSYLAALEGKVDAIVFTAGIGENDDIARAMSVQGLEALGISIDQEKNAGRVKEPRAVHADDSRVQIWVIPTNEELEIARQTRELVAG
ncbi:acetate kinase [Paucidesulfovibrio gracilis DSM 16080]|uniref:Acetate kinase n=1 Tax=Paucidesulfovibrio gracilis DSM 16080 TaxID=1121449 RepID=A0A1T4XZR1_9BACT|nr:acetate kinase [Paucidesulfovibrio gracilis]SKA95006.1 acetate kinase [Paucidesulfovibrio gracilis DSM 16080]